MPTPSTTPLRVRPRVWIGLAVFAAYALIVLVVQLSSGVPYTEWGDNGGNLFRGAGLSLLVGALFLATVTSALGWWHPALFERQRSVRWPIFVPVLMVAALTLNLTSTDWASYDFGFFAASIVLVIVGFTEEIATRGVLLVALRSRISEVWVWLVSTGLFAAMHLINVLLGQGVGPTISQVGFEFLGGTIFYILRRTTGTLVWSMVLHGLWDFSAFAVGHGTAGPFASAAGILYLIAGLTGLAIVTFVIRGAQERMDAR